MPEPDKACFESRLLALSMLPPCLGLSLADSRSSNHGYLEFVHSAAERRSFFCAP